MIDPTRLRLLLALHEQGTLHAAAETLHISPSAASQQLATLTREAGAPLTEVDGRKLRLTDAGTVLVEHAYGLLAHLERARGEVQAAAGGELGHITVGSFPSTISSLLIPAALALRERTPRLRIDIREVTVPACLDRLAGGDLDVVVAVRPDGALSADDRRFTTVALGTDDLILALPAHHPAAPSGVADLALLRDQEWISTLEDDACDRLLHLACVSAGFRPDIRHRASDWTAILALVEAGMGTALVPRAARLPIPDGVITLPTSGHDARRHIYAAIRRGTEARPAIAGYLAALKDAASASAAQHAKPASPAR
ncbi:LysR family transcriptional regulator [Actinomadura darangshiensis]|uniref:LysR family transcriptional regulator n=1 Tax=Actinomadura darangshiensis TaxID=705336 RepID=UPI00140BCEBD|nr:LysR family transcriptional regulator [Actinomadura darangshiensis]